MIPSLLLLPVALAGSLGSAPAPADLEAAYAPRRVALLPGRGPARRAGGC